MRLLLIDAGLPKPETQIEFRDLHIRADMGWREWNVAVEYDGIQHWTDSSQRSWVIERIAMLEAAGWVRHQSECRDAEKSELRELAEELGKTVRVEVIACDVADPDARAGLLAAVIDLTTRAVQQMVPRWRKTAAS